MLFNSYFFILFFLPLCVAGYFLVNHFINDAAGKVYLLGMSLWFYSYLHLSYLILILVSIGVNYLFFVLMRREKKQKLKKCFMILAVCFNLGLLFYFKYVDFFLENVNWIFHANLKLLGIALPLGISFFTFQQISFIVDAYRGELPNYSLLDYAGYVSFFPQLVAGPIVTHDELIPQLCDHEKKSVHWDYLSRGIYQFTLGLAKKVLVADRFGRVVDAGWFYIYSWRISTTDAILVMLAYTFQIYFDFSGYCDMAMGIGKMLNIDLPENFKSPYKALTITEFWERWHVTLTRFLTKYLYIPLGGNRKGKIRTYVNVMIVFLASGLWHGADWTFVIWGGVHGVFMVIARRFKSFFEKLHPALNWLITFGFVNFAWVFFRADKLKDAAMFFYALLKCDFQPMHQRVSESFEMVEISGILRFFPRLQEISTAVIPLAFTMLGLVMVLGGKNAKESTDAFRPTVGRACITVFLMTWCILSLSGVNIFLYFNF